MAKYIIRGPKDGIHNGDQPSTHTANVSLASADFAAAADPSAGGDVILCPRAFVPNYSGTLVFTAMADSSATTMIVNAGQVYPIAIRGITQASCSAALQVANAIALLY